MTVRGICRTPEEAFLAGWRDGADDPPLTEAQRTRVAALLGPYIRLAVEHGAACCHVAEIGRRTA